MKLVVALIFALSGAAYAQVYKCQINGKTVYSDSLCAAGASELDANQLRANSVPAMPKERQRVQAGPAEPRQQVFAPPVQSNCPSDREISNLETSASSVTLGKKEREFLQAEIRRARACSKEGGNYTAEDWKRIKEGQASQNEITSRGREAARARTENIHAPAASDRENERMRTDKLIQAQREESERSELAAKRAARAKQIARDQAEAAAHTPSYDRLSNCVAGTCTGTSGERYTRSPGVPGAFRRADGTACKINSSGELSCW